MTNAATWHTVSYLNLCGRVILRSDRGRYPDHLPGKQSYPPWAPTPDQSLDRRRNVRVEPGKLPSVAQFHRCWQPLALSHRTGGNYESTRIVCRLEKT